ncbi:MAG: PTS fructose transporter subunit IIABC [Metamycoplasmataceae bacterium]
MIKKEYIFLDCNFHSQNEAFKFISEKALKYKIIKSGNENNLIKEFKNRENQSSTGFENGIAIPHARSGIILKPAIFFIRTSQIDWKSLDGEKTRNLIVMMIPEKEATNLHLEILSSIATSLLDQNFINLLNESNNKEEILSSFDLIIKRNLNNSEEDSAMHNSDQGDYQILAITSCPVGVAHTYLAAEKLEKTGKELGISIKVETHGSVGVKNEFKNSEIENAEAILIASDVGIDKSRFVGKKLFSCSLKEAIHNPEKVINNSLKKSLIFNGNEKETSNEEMINKGKEGKFIKHLLSGVSYMIPFIIFGGLLIAISLGLTKIIYGDGASPVLNSPLYYILKSGEAAFGLMIAVLGGFIANSIAGRAAIAPAMITSFIANTPSLIFNIPGLQAQTPLGFFGAILYGFLIGYTVKWMNTWKIHKNVSSLMPIFIIPLGVTLFFSFLSIFLINAPISFVMGKIGEGMTSIFEVSKTYGIALQVFINILMGTIIGAMAGFDMGGPINKIAFVVCSSLLTLENPILQPMGMMAAAIPIAPLGMGIASQIYKKNFSKEQQSLGISAIVMGLIGISEGAIPFAISDPKRAIPANVIGSATAGAIAGALGVTNAVAHGGPIVGILGAVSGSFIGTGAAAIGLGITFFFVAIIAGTAATVSVYGLFLKVIKYKNEKTEVSKMNAFSNFKLVIQEKIKEFNSKKNYNANSKVISNSIMIGISGILLISGIVLLGIYGGYINELIKLLNELPNVGVVVIFDSPGFVYGVFCLVTGVLLAIASFLYSFTAFNWTIKTKNKQAK